MTKEEDEIEEMQEEVKDILRYSPTGLNKDSISAIIRFNGEIDLIESMISSLMSGTVWAEYKGDRDKGDINIDDMDLDSFVFHLTEMHPRNEEEIYRYVEPKKDKNISLENLEHKLPCLFCLQSFIEAGMTDDDAIELFNKYFPEARIDVEDCNFVRQKAYENLDEEIDKELEEKSREIVEIMKKHWKN